MIRFMVLGYMAALTVFMTELTLSVSDAAALLYAALVGVLFVSMKYTSRVLADI